MTGTGWDAERAQFLLEMDEHFATLDALVANHRRDGVAMHEAVVASARALHSIRGTAELVGLPAVVQPAHAAEDALVGAGLPGWSSAALEASTVALRLAVATPQDSSPNDHGLAQALTRLADEVAATRGALVAVTVEGDVWATGLVALTAQLVTNAAAHGIEPRIARLAAGKAACGHIAVRTWTDAVDMVVEVTDDGAGFDDRAIRHAAARRGLAATNDTRPASELAFLHGVTTRTTVGVGAGRGVGLDIVRSSVDAAEGRIEVVTARGVGSTVRLQLPA
ncbi:MAG: ATP-binding protein [Ilumatobacteraceae bacterium]